MKGNRLKNAGFTIIELTMVLVLTGILAAVAMPKYLDSSDQAGFTGAEKATRDIRATWLGLTGQQFGSNPTLIQLGGGGDGTLSDGDQLYWINYGAVFPGVMDHAGSKLTACTKAGVWAYLTSFNNAYWATTFKPSFDSKDTVYLFTNDAYKNRGFKNGDCIFGVNQNAGPSYWATSNGLNAYVVRGTPAKAPDINLAGDFSGLCVGNGWKVSTSKAGGTPTTGSGDTVKSVDDTPVKDAANCP